jgi:two-component system chemotaxis response regulator CheY
MKTLIVEDDFTSRLVLQKMLQGYGECHVAIHGKEAVQAFQAALQSAEPYDLVCLDIMMPEMDGQEALRHIRDLEKEKNLIGANASKIVMTTALNDMRNVCGAYANLCDAYLVKPIEKTKLQVELSSLGLPR